MDIEEFHNSLIKNLSKISDDLDVNLDSLNKFGLIKQLDKTLESEIILNNLFLTSQLMNNLDYKERTRYLILKTKKLRKQILDAINRKLIY
ncbi:hypothetical protein HY498_03880 [Candidatus Woesearchaeota archaeon]|nr:hypothetical protein [Candidatus Woesearchaeota archaeon]